MSFKTLDSGERQQFMSGMVRDVQKGKPRYDLIDRAFLKRWAELMGRGAEKYGEENWRLAAGEPELNRFRASAVRHLMQWLDGEADEDHAAAVAFNLAGAEMVRSKLNAKDNAKTMDHRATTDTSGDNSAGTDSCIPFCDFDCCCPREPESI